MNWALIAAGFLSLMGSLIHGVVGDRIVRRIDGGGIRAFKSHPAPVVFLLTVLLIIWGAGQL